MTFLRVTLFSLAVLLAYTLFANILPQVQSDPPQEEAVDTGTLDAAGHLAWGERLFRGKGTCTLCHNNLGRAPDLLAMDLTTALPERLADARYAGAAADRQGAAAIEAYLRESLLVPSVYVVAGFGTKGTGDTVSPMPRADGPPISLSPPEIDAIVAFLQDRAGVEVTVPLPGKPAETAAVEENVAVAEPPATTAAAVIERLACSACHDLEGSGADLGPRLDGIGARHDREGLRHAILQPNAEIVDGYGPDIMPQDYGVQIWASELELMVDYLIRLPAQEPAQ